MGLGPKGTSLLHKLGLKQAWEMSHEELTELVRKDRDRRTIQRAMGRLTALLKTTSRPKKKQPSVTLESLGFLPHICQALRKGGQSDSQIIKTLKEKGLL
jgi:hypothetical protein